jgi:hypothetical protein
MRLRRWILLALVLGAWCAPQPAAGQERAAAREPASAADDGGGIARVAVLFLVFTGAAVAFAYIRPRLDVDRGGAATGGVSGPPSDPRADATLAMPERTPASSADEQADGMAATDTPAWLPDAPVPPDPSRQCSAEIEWRQEADGARFEVLCGALDPEPATLIAESDVLEWPPSGPAAVQALTDAVDELASGLTSAGWTALEPGAAWYAKRFIWHPTATLAAPDEIEPAADLARSPDEPESAAAPVWSWDDTKSADTATDSPGAYDVAGAPAVASDERDRGLFARAPAWPQDSTTQWRCEIKWDPGWIDSRFRAVAYSPDSRRTDVIADSAVFKWLLMSQPDSGTSAHKQAVDGLADALELAGWEPAGRGAAWYARRFRWLHDEIPPERLDLSEMWGLARIGRQ